MSSSTINSSRLSVSVTVCSLLLGLGASVGCGNDADPPPAAVTPDAGDTGRDVADPPDVSADIFDDGTDPDVGPDLPAPPREATVGSGSTTLSLSFAPLSLTLSPVGDGGEASARLGSEQSFSGISFGIADSYRSGNYYEPTLRSLPTNVVWYGLNEVESSVVTEDRAEFVLGSVSEGGVVGPSVRVTVSADDVGVSLRVQHVEDPSLVFSNLTMAAQPDEGFFGLGEHFDELDLRGSHREMLIQGSANSESATNEVHVPVSFVISSRGYGVFVDDRNPSAFDLGATHDDALRMTVSSRDVTYRFVAAETPLELVERYTDLAGRPATVPYWALAPQFWRNVTTRDELLDDANRARAQGFPSSVVWIDRPWSSYYHNWLFDSSTFPNPASMFDELESLGYRVLLHHSPQLNLPGSADIDEDASEGLYDLYRRQGWLVTLDGGGPMIFPWGGGDGAFIDYSHPGAVEYVQGLLTRATDLGAFGTKMDWDEFLQPNLGPIRINLNFANGETNLTMKGWYSALYHKAIIEGFDRAQGEPTFHVSRSGTARDQVWNTCIWPGDLDSDFSEHTRPEAPGGLNVGGLPAAIVANQTLGMSGYPCFASDIGGFRGGQPDEELLVRWTQFGVFNAVMQAGGGGGTHMPWTADSEYSSAASEIMARYYRLRMDLVPYIFEHLSRSHETGRPLVRSLWFEFPTDREARRHERDFMFGPDLLVAPVYVDGADTRSVYCPAGTWLDIWTGELVEGPAEVQRPAALDTIPVFLRQGAIVPLLPTGIDTLLPATAEGVSSFDDATDFRLWIYPGAPRSESFYNGVSVSVTTPVDGGGVTASVVLGSPQTGRDPRFAKLPQTVTLIFEVAGSDLADGPGALRLEREGVQTELLEGGPDCVDCYVFDAARHQLSVMLDGGGEVTAEP